MSENDTDDGEVKRCDECDNTANWSWRTGKGGIGRYCDEHAKDQLVPKNDDLNAYEDPITTQDNATRLGAGTYIIPGGGVGPIGQSLPVIRTQEAFKEYQGDTDAQ